MTTKPKPEPGETCAHHGCERPRGRTTIVANDGQRYCKVYGEQLPSYLRSGSVGGRRGAKSSRARRAAGSRGRGAHA